MRLYAMYALDKRILSLMLVGFVLSIASQGAVVGVAFKDVRGEFGINSPLVQSQSDPTRSI
ncbi:uncharacterized protein C8R40DRAFT_1078909 [Lentinula edodes]|uniref:uncharacterized protein n=1 Tax=Lentinula edodes TaxID=5353 RepID=UPI001E8EABA0|nr:uncharacterized protein C8R40DRAFT_1078909 [Lentinula edodes]KAH7881578.1 hypothetical protein C8R40DRAFT_1078909 [Lentinula edodes]